MPCSVAPFQLWVYGPIHTPIQLFIHPFILDASFRTFHIRNPLKKAHFNMVTPRFCIYDPPLTPSDFLRASMYRQVLIEGHFTGLRCFFFSWKKFGGWKSEIQNPKVFHMVKTRKNGSLKICFLGKQSFFFKGSILNLGSVNSRTLEYKLVLLMCLPSTKTCISLN